MIPVVFLPGMMCDARLFKAQINVLSGQRPVHTAPIHGHATMQALAAEVLAHAPPRFALAGLSMGGIVAMEVLRQAPERVERIALLDTNPRAETDTIRTRRQPQIEAVKRGHLRQVMREEMKPNYLSPGSRRKSILTLCMSMARSIGALGFVNQSLALRDRPDQSETLRRTSIPALILCGRDDQLCPLERHEYMASLMPNATLQVIENAGHLPTLEQPRQTTAALQRWLD